MYKVKLEKFEGPLDLLLELIENEKLDITEVSLAAVTDQYLKYLDEVGNIDPLNLANFLVVAAQLILIKSKALLPDLKLEEEEKLSVEELEFRLKEYKEFKEAAKEIYKLYRNSSISFERQIFEAPIAFYPGKNLTKTNLVSAGERLIHVLEKFEILKQETIKETISFKEKIVYLQNLINKEVNLKFNEILKKTKTKLEAILSFLAILELVKRRVIKVIQKDTFGEIEITKISNQ